MNVRENSLATLRRWVICIVVPVAVCAGAQSPKLRSTIVCQGEYSDFKTGSDRKAIASVQDRWRMERTADNTYVVEIQRAPLSEPFRVDETRSFSRSMAPSSAEISLHLGASVHCDYLPQEIDCALKGPSGEPGPSSRLAQSKPYLFVPTYRGTLSDVPWTDQMLVAEADRKIGAKTYVAFVTLLDGKDGSSSLTVQERESVEYLGIDTISILNAPVPALKFRLLESASSPSPKYYWLSKSGLLLRVASEKSVDTELTSYLGPHL